MFERTAAHRKPSIINTHGLIVQDRTHFPVAAAFPSNEIDHAPQRIRPIKHTHRPLHNLHPLHLRKRKLIKVNTSTDSSYDWHPIYEDFDILSGETLHLKEGAEVRVISETYIELSHKQLGQINGPLCLQTLLREHSQRMETSQGSRRRMGTCNDSLMQGVVGTQKANSARHFHPPPPGQKAFGYHSHFI
jgi:hypothetical protein